MNELRISLILIGTLLIGALYWWTRRSEKRHQPKVRTEPPPAWKVEPVTDAHEKEEFARFNLALEDDKPLLFRAPESSPKPPPIPAFAIKGSVPAFQETRAVPPTAAQGPPAPKPTARALPLPNQEELLLVFHLMAKNAAHLRGPDIVSALEGVGLQLGAMDIFHFHAPGEDNIRPVFSIANVIKPGTFVRAQLAELSSPGMAIFMRLPGALSASEAFDILIDKVRIIEKKLGAELCDETRTPFTPQTMRVLRDKLMDYDFHQFNKVREAAPGQPQDSEL